MLTLSVEGYFKNENAHKGKPCGRLRCRYSMGLTHGGVIDVTLLSLRVKGVWVGFVQLSARF